MKHSGAGDHLENLVLHDLMVWRDARISRPELFYWRTQTNEEVDLVVEVDGKLIPIEIKSTTHPRLSDASHLLTLVACDVNIRCPIVYSLTCSFNG